MSNRRAFLTTAAAFGALAVAPPLRAQRASTVMLGDDVFLEEAWRDLAGRNVGIITNQTGVTSRGASIVDAIRRERPSLRVKALYAPEHGLCGCRPAGAYVPSYTDDNSGLPVYSLYGPSRHPSEAMLDGVDTLLFDIQDVGSRAYTYISTMAYAMQSAKMYDREFWVLDRPNPVGGAIVEGPVLEPAYRSFVGLYPIAMRHGMTIGELARLFNEQFEIGARLRVVPMRGWQRTMTWDQTGLTWIRTSPNIPHWQTTFVYICTGLLDSAGVNNGVGTDAPFFYAGGLDVDGDALATRLNARALPGVVFQPARWSPSSGFWANRTLRGVALTAIDPRTFLAVTTAVELLVALRELSPHTFAVKRETLDRDWGTDTLRSALLNGNSANAILAQWTTQTERFKALRSTYLSY